MTPRIRVGIGGWTFEPWRDNFFPAGWPHSARARVREPQAHRDRGQRHLLQHDEARDLREVARRDAGRLRVLAEGHALRDQPARARGGRRVDRALRGSGIADWRTSSGRSSGSSRRPSASTPVDFEAFLKLLPAEVEGLAAAPRARRAPRQLQDARVPRARAALSRRHGVHRLGRLPVVRRPDRRLRLRAPDAQRRSAARGLRAGGARPARRRARRRGATAASRRRCRGSSRRRTPARRATCSCSSSAAPRKRRRRPRWSCGAFLRSRALRQDDRSRRLPVEIDVSLPRRADQHDSEHLGRPQLGSGRSVRG